MIDVTNYKQFMGIDSFPVFDVKYYTLDLTGDYSYQNAETRILEIKSRDYSKDQGSYFDAATELRCVQVSTIS